MVLTKDKFGQRLLQHRESRNLTRAELARRIDVSPSYIYYMETGQRAAMRHTIVAIADAFQLSRGDRNELLQFGGFEPISESAVESLMRSIESALSDPEISIDERAGLVKETQAFISRWKKRRKNRQSDIRKAVVVAAGWQSRLLAFGSLEKTLVHAVGEIKRGKIGEVIFVMAPGSDSLLRSLRKTTNIAMTHVVQEEPTGLGHALLAAKKQIGEEPFAILLPDDIDPTQNTLADLVRQYKKVRKCLIAVNPEFGQNVRSEKYYYAVGLLGEKLDSLDKLYRLVAIQGRIQQDARTDKSSRSIAGRYILTPEIFDALETIQPNTDTGRYELTDGLARLMDTEDIIGYELAQRLLPLAPVRFVISKAIKSIKDRQKLEAIVKLTQALSEEIDQL